MQHAGKARLWTHGLDAWTLGPWMTGRLDSGRLDAWTLNGWMLGLWTAGRLDNRHTFNN